MKQALEKIVKNVEKIGRKSWKSVKDNAKIGVMIGAGAIGGYCADKMISNANAETIYTKAYVYPLNDVGGYDPYLYGTIYTGHTSGATINYEPSYDASYTHPYPNGPKFFTQSTDNVDLGLNMHGTDAEGWNTSHVLKLNTLVNLPLGGKEEYKPTIYYSDWSNTDDKIGVITKDRVGVNARDPNDSGTWNENNATYHYLFRDINNIQKNFGNFTGQSAGPLSEIKIQWHAMGDLNLDGNVGDFKDFEVLARNWDSTVNYSSDPTDKDAFDRILCDLESPDTHGNGIIDLDDFLRFTDHWLEGPAFSE